jgi:phosphotransferase system HPr (HPr) family protein
MDADCPVVRHQVVVGNHLGLHMRVASQFVCLARQYNAKVRVLCNGAEADGKSILDIMTLGVGFGMSVELEARGPDAEEAVAALCDLISARLEQDDE